MLAAHAADFRHIAGIHQEAQCEVVLRSGFEHLVPLRMTHPMRLLQILTAVAAAHAEGVAALRTQLDHHLGWILRRLVQHIGQHAGPHKVLWMLLHHVEHVSVIRVVEGHLDQVDAVHAGSTAVPEEFLRRKGRWIHVFFLVVRVEWIFLGIRRPDVDMCVNDASLDVWLVGCLIGGFIGRRAGPEDRRCA